MAHGVLTVRACRIRPDRADDGCEVLLQRLTQWVVKLTSSRPTHYTAGTILKYCRLAYWVGLRLLVSIISIIDYWNRIVDFNRISKLVSKTCH